MSSWERRQWVKVPGVEEWTSREEAGLTVEEWEALRDDGALLTCLRFDPNHEVIDGPGALSGPQPGDPPSAGSIALIALAKLGLLAEPLGSLVREIIAEDEPARSAPPAEPDR